MNRLTRLRNYSIYRFNTYSHLFKCNLCSFEFRDGCPSTLKEHIKNSHPDSLFSCNHCKATYHHKQSLHFHIRNSHSKSKIFRCYKCQLTCTSYADYRRHRNLKHNKRLHCEKCRYSTATNTAFINHMMIKHNISCESKTFVIRCLICNLAVNSWQTLAKHHQARHFGRPQRLRCYKCKFVASNVSEFEEHKRSAHKVCSVCRLMYSDQVSLEQHIKSSHPIHQCHMCSMTLTTLRKLEDHFISTHGFNYHECKECCRSFKRLYTLKKHCCVYDFVCEFCKKSFRFESGLSRHKCKTRGNIIPKKKIQKKKFKQRKLFFVLLVTSNFLPVKFSKNIQNAAYLLLINSFPG